MPKGSKTAEDTQRKSLGMAHRSFGERACLLLRGEEKKGGGGDTWARRRGLGGSSCFLLEEEKWEIS